MTTLGLGDSLLAVPAALAVVKAVLVGLHAATDAADEPSRYLAR